MILWDRVNLPYMHGTDLRYLFSDYFGTGKCLTNKIYQDNEDIETIKHNKTEENISKIIGFDNFIVDMIETHGHDNLGLCMTWHDWKGVEESDNIFKFILLADPVDIIYKEAFHNLTHYKIPYNETIDDFLIDNFHYKFEDFINHTEHDHVFVQENITNLFEFLDASFNIEIKKPLKPVSFLKNNYRHDDIDKALREEIDIFEMYKDKKYPKISKNLLVSNINHKDYFDEHNYLRRKETSQ